jgi:hypothetical protein
VPGLCENNTGICLTTKEKARKTLIIIIIIIIIKIKSSNSEINAIYECWRGPSRSVGIATAYGLDGRGIEFP